MIPGLERSPGEGKGYALQYSYLENFTVGCSPWGCKELNMTERSEKKKKSNKYLNNFLLVQDNLQFSRSVLSNSL